ncbi:hypothetical protein [Pseudaminobacter soli (ex Li et al. 2025)]|uniref:Uncharacterized protein n=1 Tax=Pseudaminobacter soli (ex Li et al. 2025) TaxID=1295366 RepID=A0A2P7S000_9HYPH|nr:hypothetical protein [Mesorhizobium soli]PSJ55756.1 hypothetical protein C7I85_26050 [Mesorhizobium soli]
MTGYGSASQPVNLGPFRRIVEVHWRKDDPSPTHLAVALRVRPVNATTPEPGGFAPSYWGPSYPPPPAPAAGPHRITFWDTHLYYEGRGWKPILFDIEVNGLPDYGDINLETLQVHWYWPPYDPTVDTFRWRNPTGEAIMPLPRDGGISFLAGAPSIDGYLSGALIAERQVITPTTAVLSGRTFNFVGAAARHNFPGIGVGNTLIEGPGGGDSFEMWLLFQYEPPEGDS